MVYDLSRPVVVFTVSIALICLLVYGWSPGCLTVCVRGGAADFVISRQRVCVGFVGVLRSTACVHAPQPNTLPITEATYTDLVSVDNGHMYTTGTVNDTIRVVRASCWPVVWWIHIPCWCSFIFTADRTSGALRMDSSLRQKSRCCVVVGEAGDSQRRHVLPAWSSGNVCGILGTSQGSGGAVPGRLPRGR